jgi:hypothetical protein
MKKYLKIIAFLLVVTLLFTGCVKKKENENGKNDPEEVNVVDETLIKIKDKEFHLDTDKVFEGLNYKTSKDFKEVNNATPSSKYVQFNYQPEDSANYFYFRIFYYPGKDFEFVKNDFALNEFEFSDGKTDNIEYKLIDEGRTDGSIHYYFINKDGSTYVLNFISKNDIKDFERKVLKSIKF